MGRSGNPAKAARQAVRQRTTDEAKAAVRAGKKFLVRPFPHTEVIISSTDEDEAVEVIKALQPSPEDFTQEDLDAIFHYVETMFTIVGGRDDYNERIGDFLTRVKEEYDFNKEYNAYA